MGRSFPILIGLSGINPAGFTDPCSSLLAGQLPAFSERCQYSKLSPVGPAALAGDRASLTA